MAETAFVPGATGTVGAHVVAELRSRPVTPRAAVRDPTDLDPELPWVGPDGPESDVDVVPFDFERPETWGAALSGVDRTFLLYPPGVSVDRVTEFADAAARSGVEHVTLLSILGAGSIPVLPHRRIERHLEATVPTTTFLRASYFMQNLSGIHAPEIRTRDEIFVPAGAGRVGFVDARDVGETAAETLAGRGFPDRAIDLTGPEALGFGDVADVLTDVLDREIRYADPSIPAFAWRLSRRGVPTGLVGLMIAEYTVMRAGLSSRTADGIEAVLGREPRTVREFAADHRAAFRQA
jgi:uncharacterized protein YbjT (DUF2867 family)